jgi:hypothetical protein
VSLRGAARVEVATVALPGTRKAAVLLDEPIKVGRHIEVHLSCFTSWGPAWRGNAVTICNH